MVGKGGFGEVIHSIKLFILILNIIQVWKVERKKFKTFYALKELSKVKIIQKNMV